MQYVLTHRCIAFLIALVFLAAIIELLVLCLSLRFVVNFLPVRGGIDYWIRCCPTVLAKELERSVLRFDFYDSLGSSAFIISLLN
jgi:hypothetical protein